jgi:hypothetical protein
MCLQSVSYQASGCGILRGIGAGFLRVLQFPLPIIPPISPQSPSPIIRGWYNRPVVAAVPKVPLIKKEKKTVAHYLYVTLTSVLIIATYRWEYRLNINTPLSGLYMGPRRKQEVKETQVTRAYTRVYLN